MSKSTRGRYPPSLAEGFMCLFCLFKFDKLDLASQKESYGSSESLYPRPVGKDELRLVSLLCSCLA